MTTNRRFDLDWLRVISVFAVFLHHVCMPFNGDDFHIMNPESSKMLDDVMVYFEQFRLPLLFFVSGVGTIFAFSKRTWFQFIKERSLRLLIPLIFGVVVLIPPQTFYENYGEFNFNISSYFKLLSQLKVNHLWFIENLFWMSLCSIPFILFLKSSKGERVVMKITQSSSKYGLFSWCIILVLLRIVSKHYFPSDSKSILNVSSTLYYSFYFMAGLVIASSSNLWNLILSNRRKYFSLTLLFTVLFYFYYLLPSSVLSPYLSVSQRWSIWYLTCSLLSWSVLLTVLGYGYKHLNSKSFLLTKLNEAVYPFYMLHQTVIIIIGYFIIQLNTSILSKILLLFCSSLVVIIVIYTLTIYPFKWMRFLFGMKNKN